MISLDKKANCSVEGTISLFGLSTDTKPVETFDGIKIGNGSTFFCMDTTALSMYDEEHKTWLEV